MRFISRHPLPLFMRWFLRLRQAALLLALLFFISMQAQASHEIRLPDQEYTESQLDISVQARGGLIQIERTWLNGRWYTNPAWVDLRFHFDPLDNSLKSISRAANQYSRSSAADGSYRYGKAAQISASATGWRWSNQSGDWVNFDAQGRIQSYGNAVLTQAQFIYNAAGQRTEIQDGQGRTVLSFSYNAQDLLERISSHDGRSVSYEWSGARLSQVTTVRGHHWRYQYNASGQIIQRVDPLGASITLSYLDNNAAPEPEMGSGRQAATHNSQTSSHAGLSSTKGPILPRGISRVGSYQDSLGASALYSFTYDKTKREYTNTIQRRNGARDTKTYDSQGGLVSIRRNGELEFSRVKESKTRDKNTDGAGNTTTIDYDSERRALKITHPDGSIETNQYHPIHGKKTQHRNALGSVSSWAYDSKYQLTSHIEAVGQPEQRTSRWSYDSEGQVIRASVGAGDGLGADAISQSYSYDSWGNRSEASNSAGHSSQYQHNARGQITEIRTALGHTWRYRYDAAGNLSQSTDPQGNSQSYDYDARNRHTQSTNALGHSSQISYNAAGQITRWTNALNQSTSWSYNQGGQLQTLSSPSGLKVAQSWDSQGRVERIKDSAGNEIRYVYGAADSPQAGRLIATHYPTYSEHYKYDQRGRQTQITQHLVAADSANPNPSVSIEQQRTTHLSYDAQGQLVSFIAPGGSTTVLAYDALGRVIKTTDSTNQSTEQSWNAHNRYTRVKDAKGNEHQFEYDSLGRLITQKRPLQGSYRYEYDQDNYLKKRTDAAGNSRQYSHNALGRIIQEQRHKAGQSQPEQSISYRYNAQGQFTGYSQTDHNAALISQAEYTLDALGRNISETIRYGAGAGATPVLEKTLASSYNIDDQKQSFSYPDGSTTSYHYDQGRLTQIRLPNSQPITWSNYQWQRAQEVQYPNATQTLSFDALQRSQSIEVKNQANQTLMNWRYTYDQASNITEKNTELGDTAYRYDQLNRLIQASPDAALQNLGLPEEHYEYDAVHNRKQSGHQGGVWEYNQDNQLTQWGAGAQQTEISYTSTGHTQAETKAGQPHRSYQYDAAERLTKVQDEKNNTELASYQYDPFGRRMSKVVNQGGSSGNTITWFMYAGEGLIAEFNAQGQMTKAYGWQPHNLWGTDPLWQAEVAPNKTLADAQTSYHYLHTDHLGTPQLATDKNGNTSWKGLSEAFGKTLLNNSNQITMNLRFPGQYYDQETGLHQNYFRDYNSATGRYVQGDPIGLLGGVNLYGYVEGNPVNWVDSKGLAAIVVNDSNRIDNPSASELINFINNLQPNSVDSMVIGGHGMEGSQCLNRSCSLLISENLNIIELTNSGTLNHGDFYDLIKSKFKDGSNFEFSSCNTADGNSNITSNLSEKLKIKN